MTDDPYAEIRVLRARLKRIEEAAFGAVESPTFTTSQIENRDFYLANKAAILKAASEGRIIEAEPAAPVRVERPDGLGGAKQVGQNIFVAPNTPEEG